MEHIYIWKLELLAESPLRIGDSDEDVLLDYDGKPFLSGTSITGAFRSYVEAISNNKVEWLFGKSGSERNPSRLIISDGYSKSGKSFNVQTGIAMDGKMRSVEEKGALFERITVAPGAVFEVTVMLKTTISEHERDFRIIEDVLSALHQGVIRIGAFKSIGGGKFSIQKGNVVHYDFSKKEDVIEFVNDSKTPENWNPRKKIQSIGMVHITITGQTATPLLIGGQPASHSDEPDKIHVMLEKEGMKKPIIPASSLKGVLRHRVQRIANILRMSNREQYVAKLFGTGKSADVKQMGNLLLEDIILQNAKLKTYYRIGINPLTGGVKNGALVEEQTVHGTISTTVSYKLTNKDKQNKKDQPKINDDSVSLALLLFALRDLGMQHLPIGSGSSIGRGYLTFTSMYLRGENFETKFDFQNHQILGSNDWLDDLQNELEMAISNQI